MRERLWSAAKMGALRGMEPDEEAEIRARRRYFGSVWAEKFLDQYPYLDVEGKGIGVREGERVKPDYVVRNGRMGEDLGKLMKAFGCEEGFVTKNVHIGKEKPAFLKERVLEFGDRRYEWLARVAEEGNERGLELARGFV